MTSTLLQIIDKLAADSPNKEAVRWLEQSLSYQDLVDGSIRVAQGLSQRGITSESRVGISLNRGLDLAVGLLGIYRAGAAYVPLDPNYPMERLQAMVHKAALDLIVTDAQDLLDASNSVSHISVDDLKREAAEKRYVAASASQSGYVIFTSGSSGTPKGVVLGRPALENLICWQASQPRLGQATQVLQFTPTSFDVHFQEFFGTWVTGGTLVMVSEEIRRDPQQLAQFLAQQAIGRLFLPFVALRQLADVVVHSKLALPNLRDVVTAGEQLVITDSLRTMFSELTDCRLHNHYGPSETHVATTYELPSVVSDWEELPPIGKPIESTLAIILNESRVVESCNEIGELYLGGTCVAAGYAADPKLTKERFVSLPGESTLFYQTGDLVYRDTNGHLHYQGRADNQVKIRGYRVEVGEVEAQLNKDGAIRDSAVVAQDTFGGDKRLIAYLVPDVRPTEQAESNQATDETAIDQWRQVWDLTYSKGQQSSGTVVQLNPEIDPKFDIRGWNSSYTGLPLKRSEMQEWVQGTRERILALKPKRLLEVGAGTGLILFAVAREVEHYQALDYSAAAIGQLQTVLGQEGSAFAHCHAVCGTAHDLSKFASDSYDTIVINSVTQHFESSLYLEQVLAEAASLLPSGGSVFLGDITARCTREWFFSGVEAIRGGKDLSDEALRRRVTRRLSEERELTIDAEFFYSWAKDQANIASVSVQLKPGNADSELTNFRYDVTLVVHPHALSKSSPVSANSVLPSVTDQQWSDYNDLDSLSDWLSNQSSDAVWALRLENIPNARLLTGKTDWQRFIGLQDGSDALSGNAIHPDAMLALASRLGLQVQTVFGDNGSFTATFSNAALPSAAMLKPEQRELHSEKFTSRPYLASAFPDIVKRIRPALEKCLPEYMLPARYVMLQALPLTPSGKLDRLRLPEPNSERPDLPDPYVAANSDAEQQLVDIWQQMLELDQVGVFDNFFELGGTSILSLQLVNEISSQLQTNVSIVQLFEAPTIRALCATLDQTTKNAAGVNNAQQRARKQQQVMAKTRAMRIKSRSR